MSSQPIAAYTFLPWARQGLGVYIREGDQDQSVNVRGSMEVALTITGEQITGSGTVTTPPLSRPVQLYGPGDILGIDAKAIIRTEPRHWITNFEANYLPFVEFYDEDFPWRYTPAKATPDNKRLRPWLALVVLEESEFEDKSTDVVGRPLPYIQVEDADQKFPPFDQLWAWAHVHVNGELGNNPNDVAALATRLDETVRTDRDSAYSRLLCPRILKTNTAYHAFLIPSFETGRLAGLKKDPNGAPWATHSAWIDYVGREEPTSFPYYHRWYFRTGTVGDFEYLVRLLQPRTVDPRVGRRDMDVQQPGVNLPPIPELGGVLRLGGALRAPLETLSEDDRKEHDRFEEWGKLPDLSYPHDFQTALAALINLAEDYKEQAAAVANAASGLGEEVEADEDPLIVPPIYGRWHSETHRLVPAEADPDQQHWVQELNLDPRHRVAGGFGTQVVQKNQENYMEAAWQQVGKVLEGNRKIRFGQMAKLVSMVWHRRELAVLKQELPQRFLMVAAPVQRRVLGNGVTIHYEMRHSMLPVALMSKTVRQALRPRARIAKLGGFNERRRLADLLERVNRGEISAAPVKTVAPALPVQERLAKMLRSGRAADVLRPDTRTPAAVDELLTSPDFRIGEPGRTPPPKAGERDSPEAARFKASLRNLYTVDVAERAIKIPVRQPLDLATVAMTVIESLRPEQTIPRRVLAAVVVPLRIRQQMVEEFGEVMVYPEIDLPMYEPLKDISSELFLPNIQLIENNSITLLETNQKFIESYMVGLNHEFARELLWREYPTDQRGSYFRQFWDVRGFLAEPGADPQVLRERLRDIPELHRWSKNSALGDHDHREAQGDKEDEVVLAIRGELLKKYPTAVIYTHRAAWERTNDNKIDRTRPRKLVPLTPLQEADPPRDLVKTPLYEAKVDPDIYLFGFDLTAEKARGGPVEGGEEDPGWFFVIKERPGEPRFGLDLPKPAPQTVLHTWNDLAWSDVMNTFTPGGFLPVGERTPTLTNPGSASDAKNQYDEDQHFHWQANTHAAELAYILFQVPVLMAVHAAEMLKKPE